MSNPGVKLHGSGFIVTKEEAEKLGLGNIPDLEMHIRQYRNGRDITAIPRGVMVIDLFGLSSDEVKIKFPEVYHHVLLNVKPERDQNRRKSRRENWWLFGETNPKLRKMLEGLQKYIATVETSKHRFFVMLDESILPDNMLVVIALEDPYYLGILSSKLHIVWALAQGGTLEDRPRYNKTRCFETFPFPDPTEEQEARIRELAEQLDAHRKRRQERHTKLTLTAMYNVLEKIRAGEPLTAKEKTVHEDGLVSILKQLHDDLDDAVFAAYGWPSTLTDEEILQRLVDLNLERAAEEAGGYVRWLRPDYQAPGEAQPRQATFRDADKAMAVQPVPVENRNWPKALKDRAAVVREVLASIDGPVGVAELAGAFNGRRTQKRMAEIRDIVEMLVDLGQIGDERIQDLAG